MSLAELLIKIKADVTQATAGLAAVNRSMTKLDKSVMDKSASVRRTLNKLAKAFAMLGAAAAVGLALAVGKATATFVDFEQAVTNAASVTGKSGPEYEATKKNIESLAKTLGETTVFSAQQAANALYDLSSAGYDVGTMVKSDLEPIMNLAAATQADLTFTTETVTSTLGQFGLGIEDSIKVSDVFAKTIGSSKATLEKLAMSMKYVGPVAHALGMDIEDVNAMLGVLYNAGFKGEQAGTSLRAAMSRLMNPTKAVSDVLERLGLTYDEVNPATHDFADTLALLEKSGIDANLAMQLFGVEAGPAMLSLMGNTEAVTGLEAALRNAAGASEDMATKQLDTLKGSLTLLKSAFEGLMISVGEMAAPAVKRFAIILRDIIPDVKILAEEGMVKLKEIITDLAPTWEGLKSIFVSVKGIITDVLNSFTEGGVGVGTFTDAINSLVTGLAKVFDWIDKHPEVTKLAVVILAVAAAFAYVLPVVAGVIGAVTSLVSFVLALAGAIGGASSAMGAIGAVIALLGGPITVIIAIIAALAAAWTLNLFGIRDKTKGAIDFIKGLWERFKSFLTEHTDMIVNILLVLMGPIGLIILAFKNWEQIKDIVGRVKDWLGTTMDTLVANAKEWGINLLNGFIDGIKSKIDNLKNTIGNVSSTVKDYIGIESPAKKGPLKDLMEWGPNLTKTFSEGIAEGIGDINTTFGKMVEPTFTKKDIPKSGRPPQSFVLNINNPVIREDKDIDALAKKIEMTLTKNTRGIAV